ncbi:MAG: hypothetical protein JRJ62_16250 [Deltaproteobacteria bacterium]|nr:hypothetical protein [Deltaproteobacteria bacterium]
MKSLLSGIKNFLWPKDSAVRLRRAEMTFWAFILALAYLPLPFGFLAWFALARPLAIVVKLDSKSAFKAAYFYSFMANLFQLYWVAVVTPPGMIAAIFIMSLYRDERASIFMGGHGIFQEPDGVCLSMDRPVIQPGILPDPDSNRIVYRVLWAFFYFDSA